MNFRDRFMKHETEFEEIYDLAEKWGFSDDPRTLREYLGLTAKEEDVWISESDEALEELLLKERDALKREASPRAGKNGGNTRILFTDLDGTLLSSDNTISRGNQLAIDEALSAGHKIVAATGRPLPSAKIQTERLGLNREGCYAITYNGGLIYDLYRQETVFEKPVAIKTALELMEAAAARKLHIQTYSDTHILSFRETPELKKYSSHALLPYKILKEPSSGLPAAPHKLLAIDYHDHEKLLAYQSYVLEKYAGELNSFFSNDDFLEIVPHGIDKGFAVRWLCDFLGVPIENSVAAGDAQNDIAMLEAAHIGAVMCNAFPGIREHGNYVTEADNNHDGVAEIIRKFILSD